MATYVKLTSARSEAELSVNMDRIIFVCNSANGPYLAYGPDGQEIYVKESLDEIMRRIEAAEVA